MLLRLQYTLTCKKEHTAVTGTTGKVYIIISIVCDDVTYSRALEVLEVNITCMHQISMILLLPVTDASFYSSCSTVKPGP